MEAPFHIVGCVLSSQPAAERVDAFVAQLRRERAAILVKTAQGATFVRFNATDARLVMLAVQALRGPQAASLRFGFAAGTKEPTSAGPDAPNISTRSIVHASDLAAGAGDGEVLVSPQLAVLLIESGVALRSRQIHLPGGRIVPACVIEPASADPSKPAERPSGDKPVADAPDARPKARVAAPGVSHPLLQLSQEHPEPPPATLPQADALGQVFLALTAQAQEMARRQSEFEAQQEALLARMTLVDEGSRPARHVADLDAEVEVQMARVQARLDFIDTLEQRVSHLQTATRDLERKLSDQLARRADVENLTHLCDTLVAQMADAQHRLDAVAALQERLLPMISQVATLAQALQQSQEAVAGFEGRLCDLDRSAEQVDRKIDSLGEREALVQAVRAEVEEIQAISARSRADLEFLTEHRGELLEMRGLVDDLRTRMEGTDDKIETIESHRLLVEDVQSRTNAFTHMLGDLQLNLEMLEEQRAVVEHVGEKLARLDFTVQEAQNTLRALQREREVAERVQQGMKTLRARGAPSKLS